MDRKILRKFTAFILVFTMVISGVETGRPASAEVTSEKQVKPVKKKAASGQVFVVTPFAGLWKYYGQTRKFVEDVHYSVSVVSKETTVTPEPSGQPLEDEVENVTQGAVAEVEEGPVLTGESETVEVPAGWELSIESEEAGEQIFVLKSTVEGEEVPENVRLVENAPTYEIRKFHTTEVVTDFDYLTAYVDEIEYPAPEGYLISSGKDQDGVYHWKEKLVVSAGDLQEGENTITYYLQSNQSNETRKAIDQEEKQTKVIKDSIIPSLSSVQVNVEVTDTTAVGTISGSEAGMYYYMALPVSTGDTEVTPDLIRQTVELKHGVVGYGRLDGQKATEFTIEGMAPQTEYRVYACMVDTAGNPSEDFFVSESFITDKMALNGTVAVSGTVELEKTLTAVPQFTSVDPGTVSYQWYRMSLASDTEEFEAVYDESGGEDEDMLEADVDEEDLEDDGEVEDEDDEEDTESGSLLVKTFQKSRKKAEDASADDVVLIEGATDSTYQITEADLGCRLVAYVTASNYSGYIHGMSETFVPKLVPAFTVPSIASAVYSPMRKLENISLAGSWSWVKSSIVPVVGNNGYRARFVPENTKLYKTVITRVPVPLKAKALKKSMVTMATKKVYTGGRIKNNFKLKDGKKTLKHKKDFTVTYKDNKHVGRAVVTFKGIGNYKNKIKKSYRIVKCSVANMDYTYNSNVKYTGKKVGASVSIRNEDAALRRYKDYTITYERNVEIGRGKITIKGIGPDYKGKKVIGFNIVPKTAKVQIKKKKGSYVLLKFQKIKNITGYYVYLSTKKSFSKKYTQTFVTKEDNMIFRGLNRGGKYYVRVKTYKAVKGKRYSSVNSKRRLLKIAK